METWLICFIILCFCFLLTTGSLVKKDEENMKAIRHLQHCNTILARRLKELDGIEMEEIQHATNSHSITILLDPEGGAPEVRIDGDE